MALHQKKLFEPLLLLHLLLLIFMLYGVTTLVEQQPRFSIVYQHAGITEFIMRTGTVDPYLEAYFNWPGFFIFSAFLTRIAGYHDILGYATWAPVYFNLFYLAPLYIIFTTATTDKRIIWLGLCFFYLTNWIAQDYYSPQGLNFLLYLLVLAILLKWFKRQASVTSRQQPTMRRRLGRLSPFIGSIYEWLTAPDTLLTPVKPRQRRTLLASIVVIFAFMVFSHPLTPFFTIAAVTALVVFGRITPRWLPVLMSAMTVAWAVFMARPYLAGHLAAILSDIGQLGRAVTSNVTSRVVAGNPEHILISEIRIVMTCIIWSLACAGAILRLRQGYRDVNYILLAIVPFSMILIQSYGGEMLLRIYFFTLPIMAFFAAALFYATPAKELLVPTKMTSMLRAEGRALTGTTSLLVKVMIGVVSVVLLVGFLFTRYGNERVDYVTNAELAGIRHLYSIAPTGSLLLAGWDETSWQFQGIEQYRYYVLSDDTDLSHALITKNVAPIVQFIESSKTPKTYLILTRSQKAMAQRDGLPPDTLDQFEHALLTSRKFVLVYNNIDAQIFLFIRSTGK
ncbi:MAG: hypothetical protein JO125_13670 [Chloroflexi bacterium]|nr:hypothetical protein [Ktedonobacteraceae bacterium]MBV9019995.1 hypothetical protein [Ktedonobacteraceae bacterium]MBV9708449.1 hypothetical protein [Chloroflexota bacterium]